jgi:hypothetical protein
MMSPHTYTKHTLLTVSNDESNDQKTKAGP